MARSKSSQNLATSSLHPSPTPTRHDIPSDVKQHNNLYYPITSRQSAGSIGTYDAVYVRERRGGLDCTGDVRVRSNSAFQLDGANQEGNSSDI